MELKKLNHNYEVVDFHNYREMFKGQEFDPKRMPLGTDYRKVEVCSKCGARTITCGIFIEGREYPTGLAMNSKPCDPSLKDENTKLNWEIDNPGKKYKGKKVE